MLEIIRKALAGRRGTPSGGPGAGTDPDDLQVAACALLLELAHADDEFSADERRHIEAALARHFSLGAEAVLELMALAEDRRRICTSSRR
jgi:uncharacterized tellurite resistance protein B-like protein